MVRATVAMDTDAAAMEMATLGVAVDGIGVGISGDVDDDVCTFGNKLDTTALCNTCDEAEACGCGKGLTRTPGVPLAVAAERTLVGGVDKAVSNGFVDTPFDAAETV